ncbi:hypothetical protein F511_27798 [Dorcoceras hygrometricum]|uniref:Uncharacterized protein n=1 Tax=Dorcoceras hygrometricum TaxID=472368 RepID=A0A2Z7BX24_9LAMI|nr:hypothetical protein F511_27798 [Dorcoceras hygrometricum]
MTSFTANTVHVNFGYVLTLSDEGMVQLFCTLESSRLGDFLGVLGSMYEEALNQFFVGASAIDGKVVSAVGGHQMVITKDLFIENFGLLTEGITSFGKPYCSLEEMKVVFWLSGVSFNPSKKKEMNLKYRLLNDIVAKL